jgi:hypothetical protein
MDVIHYIVVPEGLRADGNNNPIPEPSFVFRQVLDYVLDIARDCDSIYLAPANNFGARKYEQDVAFDYLKQNGTKCNVCVFTPSTTKYIDTRGNAYYLKLFLKEKCNNISFQLISEKIHSFRAEYCFKKTGFKIVKTHRVAYSVLSENIVNRIWHHKNKFIHFFYETCAFIRDVTILNFSK